MLEMCVGRKRPYTSEGVNVNQSNSGNASNGIGFPGLLTIVFIALKLTGYIDWSWWWVLSPMWITALLAVAVVTAVVVWAKH